MLVRLIVTNKVVNETTTTDLTVLDKVTIGRHLGSPIALHGDRLSRHHFSLSIVDGSLTLENLSSNGTWLNGSPLNAKMASKVESGDMIEIPGYEIGVVLLEIVASQKPQSEASVDLPSTNISATHPLTPIRQILEPREIALLLFALGSFTLISVFLTQ